MKEFAEGQTVVYKNRKWIFLKEFIGADGKEYGILKRGPYTTAVMLEELS